MFETRTVDTVHLLRAIGISLVVFNHSQRFVFAGGLNILFLLSGMSFAALAFQEAGKPIWRVSWEFVRRLLTLSVIFCLFWSVARRDFHLTEVLMISNLIVSNRISGFPILYTQVTAQLLLILALVLSVPGLKARFTRSPVAASLSAFVVAVCLLTVSKLSFDTISLRDKLPHLFAWNFVLGWVFWAILHQREPSHKDKWALSGVVLGLALLAFPILQMKGWETRLWLFPIPVLLLIWNRRISLPNWIAHPALLVSQAILSIFFLHFLFVLVGRNGLRLILDDPPQIAGGLVFLIALAGPVVVWAAMVAVERVWRRRDLSNSAFIRRLRSVVFRQERRA